MATSRAPPSSLTACSCPILRPRWAAWNRSLSNQRLPATGTRAQRSARRWGSRTASSALRAALSRLTTSGRILSRPSSAAPHDAVETPAKRRLPAARLQLTAMPLSSGGELSSSAAAAMLLCRMPVLHRHVISPCK